YPYPNRSHFRSIEIWDTASSSSQTLSEGWIAQAFEGAKPPAGAGVDCITADTNALPGTGPSLRTIVMQDAENFLRQAAALKAAGARKAGATRRRRPPVPGRQEIIPAARGRSEKLPAAPAPAPPYPPALPFARQLDLATRVVAAHVPVVAIKVAM